MSTQYLPGALLHNFCNATGPLGEQGGLFFMKQIVDALSYMHIEKGIAHRDLHSGNIMVGPGLRIKLFDFGNAV